VGFLSGKFSQIRKKKAPCQFAKPSFSMIRTLVWRLNSYGKPTSMIQDISIAFLSEKIKELENALFMSESNALISLPTHIVRITEVDGEGNIWFIIPRPTQVIESFSKEMPAKLDFFKKGKNFFLKISGVASIVWSAEEMKGTTLNGQFSGSFEKDNVVAVKVKVESSEYMEKTSKPSLNPLFNVGSQFYNWLLNPLFNA
jgi:general stress protein 26